MHETGICEEVALANACRKESLDETNVRLARRRVGGGIRGACNRHQARTVSGSKPLGICTVG